MTTLNALEGKPDRTTKLSATLGVPFVGSVTATGTEPLNDRPDTFKSALAAAVRRVLVAGAGGIAVVLDEMHDINNDELTEIGTDLQHEGAIENQPIAFAAAALASIDEVILKSKGTTFLTRCDHADIGALSLDEAADAIGIPFADAGMPLGSELLAVCAEASDGFPYLCQLIGAHLWRSHDRHDRPITRLEIDEAIGQAQERVDRLVLLPMWKELTDKDREFAIAMIVDDGPTAVADLAARLGKSAGWIGKYRARLIHAGFISGHRRGQVEFTHPRTANWLRDTDQL
jgi:hypothetical protein